MPDLARRYYFLLSLIAILGILVSATRVGAQDAKQPWMDKSLSPAERADLAGPVITDLPGHRPVTR